jgi:hypothetical protein
MRRLFQLRIRDICQRTRSALTSAHQFHKAFRSSISRHLKLGEEGTPELPNDALLASYCFSSNSGSVGIESRLIMHTLKAASQPAHWSTTR